MANDTPRTKEKEVRTAEIEQAARKVFFSRGFQAATIQEIAEEAGIAKGTVYLYYKSKDDLYTALLLPSLEFLNEKFNALLDEVEREKFESGEELFEALGDMFIELQARDPEMVLIYQGFQVGTFITSVSKETRERLNGFAEAELPGVPRDLGEGDRARAPAGHRRAQGGGRDLGAHSSGVAQVEWNKLQESGKDHFRETLRYALAMVYGGICASQERASGAHGWARADGPRRPRRGPLVS